MVRLNLQLFAKKTTDAIVNDVIRGKYGNGEARKTALTNAGYNYSEVQSAVNAKLKGNTSSTTTTNTNKNTNTNKTTTTTSNQSNKPEGWSQNSWDKANQEYKPSDKYEELDKETNTAYNDARDFLSKDQIIDQSYMDKMNEEFVVPESVIQADAWLTSQREALQSGKTSWTDKYNAAIDKYLNREKFEYDVDNDQLFQQALASAMSSGQTAMQDTIGQASALTGGYGSTYATSAGNQAYNSFIQDAYANLPQYYQMALSAYEAEGQDLFNQVAMLGDADATEYGKMMDAYNITANHRNQLYSEAYNVFRDGKTDAYNAANLQLSEYGQLANNKVALFDMAQTRSDSQYEKDFKNWEATINQYMQLGNTEQTSYWNQKNFDANYTSDGKGGYVAKGKDDDAVEYKTPTQSQKAKALESYNNGGEDEYYKYLDSLPSNIDVEEIDTYVMGKDETKGYGQLPYSQRTYEVIDDGGNNYFWGIDNNAKVKDQYGNEYTLEQLAKYDKEIALELSKKDYTVGKSYTKQKK